MMGSMGWDAIGKDRKRWSVHLMVYCVKSLVLMPSRIDDPE